MSETRNNDGKEQRVGGEKDSGGYVGKEEEEDYQGGNKDQRENKSERDDKFSLNEKESRRRKEEKRDNLEMNRT